jgi:hypothetical protein
MPGRRPWRLPVSETLIAIMSAMACARDVVRHAVPDVVPDVPVPDVPVPDVVPDAVVRNDAGKRARCERLMATRAARRMGWTPLPSAGKIPMADIVTRVDDTAVILDYGPGQLRLAVGEYPRVATWIKELSLAGAKRLPDGPPLTPRTTPKYSDPARHVPDVPAYGAALETKALKDAGRHASISAAVGKYLAGTRYRLTSTNGHVAVFDYVAGMDAAALASEAPERTIKLATGPGEPVRCTLDAAFWRAYGRVRTCRHPRIDSVWYRAQWGGLGLGAGDDEQTAYELIPGGVPADDGRWICVLADAYVWPLRGLTGAIRQRAENDPIWIQTSDTRAVVIMPMRTEATAGSGGAIFNPFFQHRPGGAL